MDTHRIILYLGSHETPRHTREPGETSPPGDPPVEGGQAVSRRRHDRGCITELRGSMATSLSNRGQARIAREALAGANSIVDATTARTLGALAARRPLGSRLCDKPLDVAPNRRTHPSRVWHSVYDTEYLEADARHGLELPKARQTRPGAQREGHSVLEATGLASHKKKPQNLEPTWASLTRAGSYSYPQSPARGRRRVEHRSSRRRAIGRKSPPSPLSRFHPDAGASDCIVDFIPIRTSALNRFFSSSGISCVISADRWFFSGIVDCRTERRSLPNFSSHTRDCTFICCHPMLQNSIPMNSSGTT